MTQAVAGHVRQRVGQYSPQSLSNVMWAFATQETHPGSSTLDAVALFVCKSLQVDKLVAPVQKASTGQHHVAKCIESISANRLHRHEQ